MCDLGYKQAKQYVIGDANFIPLKQGTSFVFNNFVGQAGNDLHIDGSARILPKDGGETSGHGMAFVVSDSLDFKGAEPTRFFGIFNSNGSMSTRVLAIELDISLAPELDDISDNHVGIDVNSAVSLKSENASYYSDKEGKKIDMKLLSGDPIQVWVDYEGKTLNVTIAPLKNKKPSRPLVSSTTINLTGILQSRRMFVGFSGATGSIKSYQYVLGWSFSKTMASLQSIDFSKLPKVPQTGSKKKSMSLVLDALLGLIAFLVLGLLIAAYLYRRNMYSEVREEWEKEFGPLRYSYKSLYKATKGFSRNEFLGRGGFGEVFKGTLPRSREMREVAVKRVSHDGEQGMKQFVAEIVSMRSLKHRSLVPLLGSPLPWWRRLAILQDIASALSYLHTEADQVVIHRDIKASNVMLDAEFNGRLGDFGMSKLYDRGSDPTTTAAVGTLGYMAPELTTMGASTATDVYAFGVFLLEVVCGRRPIEPSLSAAKRYLVKWVCDCWKRSSLIDAKDPRLTEFSSQEVEKVLKLGLLCANLTSDGRPTMEQVVQYLNGNLALPEFWPSSPGIGVLTPMALSPAPLVIPSLSLSSSSSNNSSMFITHSVLYGTGR
ncbi:hypothetical protein AALP_AA8G399900 [Arabis alpina]|uniref:non-specific serine/threonine protein kinase n=1 Tax=Arabis alpina TaxID=50452 RepID=A0A087GCF9_ARAAL|nr:hypothetical protein AALP_AA8G399900 [Arabis alpina]